MKNYLSRKTLVALLIIGNVAAAAFYAAKIVNKKRAGTHSDSADSTPRKAVLEPALFKSKGDLQPCYESFLKREPKVDEGSVVVHWRIGRDGQIEFLKMIHSDLEDQIFQDCVMDRIKSAHFANRHGGQLVAHTFNFHRKDPAALNFQ